MRHGKLEAAESACSLHERQRDRRPHRAPVFVRALFTARQKYGYISAQICMGIHHLTFGKFLTNSVQRATVSDRFSPCDK